MARTTTKKKATTTRKSVAPKDSISLLQKQLTNQEELIKLAKLNAVESAQILQDARSREHEMNTWRVIFLLLLLINVCGMILIAWMIMLPSM